MRAKENIREKEDLYSYLNYINRDSSIFKGQMIFAYAILVAFILFIILSS